MSNNVIFKNLLRSYKGIIILKKQPKNMSIVNSDKNSKIKINFKIFFEKQ